MGFAHARKLQALVQTAGQAGGYVRVITLPEPYLQRTQEIDCFWGEFHDSRRRKRCGRRASDGRRKTGQPIDLPVLRRAGTGGLHATNGRISRIRNSR